MVDKGLSLVESSSFFNPKQFLSSKDIEILRKVNKLLNIPNQCFHNFSSSVANHPFEDSSEILPLIFQSHRKYSKSFGRRDGD
jgi:hypothetical protein